MGAVACLGSLKSAIPGGLTSKLRRCPTAPILSLPKFRKLNRVDVILRQQIVAARAGDSPGHEFAHLCRFG